MSDGNRDADDSGEAISRAQTLLLLDSKHPQEREDVHRSLVQALEKAEQENEQLRAERDRLHRLVCDARAYIDPEKHAGWEADASAEAESCEQRHERLRALVAQQQALLARVVVVMEGWWDVLPFGEQDALAEELRRAVLAMMAEEDQ